MTTLADMPIIAGMSNPHEFLALQLQIDEMVRAIDFLVSQRLTLSISSSENEMSDCDTEELVLQAQLDSLICQRNCIQSELCLKEESELEIQQKRTVDVISEAASEDDRVAQHDRRLALHMTQMSDSEWNERGDLVEDPIPPPLSVPNIPQSSTTVRSNRENMEDGIPIQTQNSADVCNRASCPASRSIMCEPGEATKTCLICFDEVSPRGMISALRDISEPSSSNSEASCSHYYCIPCMRQYVKGEVHSHKYPIACPTMGCKMKLQSKELHMLLDDDLQQLTMLRQLEVEFAISPDERLYCPYKDCSALLIKSEAQEDNEGPTQCPVCVRVFCSKCIVTGWHQGFTCQEFQDLPPHLKSSEDAAMLKMSEQHSWKACPTCKMLVERIEGCNHMHCRCQTSFCYKCGLMYQSKTPSADNVHGTPACKCALFDVPEEAAAGMPAGQALPRADYNAPPRLEAENLRLMHPPLARPIRGGRKVSRRPCRHSHSLEFCPQSDRCWFWHEEDGDF